MLSSVDQITQLIPPFALIFCRISGMLATLPILSYPMISAKIRIMFGLVLTSLLLPVAGAQFPEAQSFVEFLILIVKEVFIGLTIGFGARVIFESLNMAGSFIGRQMGLAMANVMDPTSRQQLPVISQFWLLLLMVLLLVTDSHHLLMETLYRNFELIPLGAGELTAASGRTMISTGTQAFAIALKLAAPAMVFLLLVDASIAFTARVMPQMNIFLVTLPLKIGMGIFIVIFSIDIFQIVFDSVVSELEFYFGTIIQNMRGIG